MKYFVVIPGWRPPALNELLRGGPWGARRLKAEAKDFFMGYTLQAQVPPARGKRRISLILTIPKGQRKWDIDAFHKATLDACTHAKLIIDDHPKWAQWGGVTYIRPGDLSTTIVAEDIEE